MDEKLSRRIALSLLAASTAEEVKLVLEEEEARYYFADPQNWSPYGNREKNWDTVGNQQTNPIGAFVELITNGIDTTLLRHARESGIKDNRGPDAPQSMFEAVKRFFPEVNEGKIAKLSPEERTRLAQQCMLIAVQRGVRKNHTYPTYTLVDAGDGQLPQDFPKTFLSLGEKNKEGIPFVQGKFNMGSTGSLRFCTRSDIRLGHYKLVLSRRPGQPYWGWTLVRVRGPQTGEALPVAEYFHINRASIPKFGLNTISAFGHETLGQVKEGSIIRLYEYDIGPEARAVDLGLYNALTVNLLECALPVQLYDFNAKPIEGKGALRKQGIAARTFGGLNVVLRADLAGEKDYNEDDEPELSDKSDQKEKAVTPQTEWVHEVSDVRDEELGRFRIVATAVSRLKDFLRDQPARIFYTINGQTHAFERASFLNNRVGLPDLRNHVLINIICDEMNKQALATIFMPDRERRANTDLSRRLEKRVIDEIKSDDRLRAYAAEIRMRRASEHIEDKGETAELLQELVKSDPAIRDLFGLGTLLPEITPAKGGQKPYKGKKYPTFLSPLNLRLEGEIFIKEVPLGGARRIECGTDAADDYLTRIDSPGETWCSLDEHEAPHSVKLRNGTARITVTAPKNAKVGQITDVEFGFKDYGRNLEPLKFRVQLRYIPEEKTSDNPSGKTVDTKPKLQASVGQPEFRWVPEDEWSEHSFDEESGAYVSVGEQTTVHVNKDNRYLRGMRAREKDDATRLLDENIFRLGLGLLALAVYKRADRANGESGESSVHDPDALARVATSGMAPYIVTIIRKLGGSDAKR